jgi:hypothetical protein
MFRSEKVLESLSIQLWNNLVTVERNPAHTDNKYLQYRSTIIQKKLVKSPQFPSLLLYVPIYYSTSNKNVQSSSTVDSKPLPVLFRDTSIQSNSQETHLVCSACCVGFSTDGKEQLDRVFQRKLKIFKKRNKE